MDKVPRTKGATTCKQHVAAVCNFLLFGIMVRPGTKEIRANPGTFKYPMSFDQVGTPLLSVTPPHTKTTLQQRAVFFGNLQPYKGRVGRGERTPRPNLPSFISLSSGCTFTEHLSRLRSDLERDSVVCILLDCSPCLSSFFPG